MIHLGIVFGSRTAEHDVSIISGLQILENLDKTKYDAYPIYIAKNGEWFIGDALRDVATYENFNPDQKGLTRVFLPPVPGVNGLLAMDGKLLKKTKTVCPLDVAILAMHGMHGEDGTLQGLFELADIPYSSCGVTSSAVGMDKIIMKAVFKSMGLPVLESTFYYRSTWQSNPEAVLDDAEKLGFPLYVKPANLGSSIGISRATDRESLRHAIDVAVGFDRRILVERGIDKPIEINCACLGYGNEVTPSLCEQPTSWQEFLTFEDKYTRSSGKAKGMASNSRQIPAPISDEMTNLIRDYTAQVFRTFECKGVVRIDYMIDPKTNQVYINEINTIPGSFAFYLFEPMGMPFPVLVDRLVSYAFKALEEKHASNFAYESDILAKVKSGTRALKTK